MATFDVASPLASVAATRAVLDEFGLATKHHLGQNFLVNDGVIAHILELAQLTSHDAVVEVGPGIGTLTVALLSQAGAVCSIETDRTLEPVLASTCAEDADRFALIMGDALKVTPDQVSTAMPAGMGEPTAFVSNLPYQVAATVLLRFFQQMPSLDRAIVMVQAEVADRIAARPGTKAYGAYTAKLALRGRVTGRFEVGPGNFFPPPHVDSAVVRIERAPMTLLETGEPLDEASLTSTAGVIDAAFAQRRKTIRNSMAASGFDKALLDEAFATCGIAPTARAETLEPEIFVDLAAALGWPAPGKVR